MFVVVRERAHPARTGSCTVDIERIGHGFANNATTAQQNGNVQTACVVWAWSASWKDACVAMRLAKRFIMSVVRTDVVLA